MDCDDCLERLYQYLDRELSENDVTVVRQHLDDCEGCSGHFVFEERFIKKVHDACAGDRAPVELRERIVLRIRES
jgi:mycothiol system anti-sigma-R factor